MNEEIVKKFLGKKVKLVKEGYALYGIIRQIEDDSIYFESQTTTSAIKMKLIDEIMLVGQ